MFDPDRLWIMDRNFPGVPRIAAMLATGTHVLIRVKSDIRLPRIGAFAADGSYLTTVSGGGTTLTMRVVEYHVDIDGQTTPELFCLVTDLLDHHTHPAHLLAEAYRWRWDGSETALREAKSAIHDAGPATGAILRSATPELIRQEHAAWIVATELVHAATRSRRRHRPAVPEGPPHRPAGRGPAPVVHHRPPHPDRHRAGRYRHRLAARTRPGRRPPPRPGRDRHRPRHHRPTSSPRPQDQNQAAVPARPARHHHPHRPRPRARLRHRGLTRHRRVPRAGHHPGPGTRRTRPDSRAAAMRPARHHSPYTTSKITTRVRRSANYLISLALTDHHAGTTWAPVGQTPVVEVTGERKSVNMISAVSPGGTLHFDVFFGTCDATVFVEFLKKLMHGTPGPVFLILDNLSVHKAPPVKEYVASLDGRLKLFFLPGYSPELNPDEWVWKNVKHDHIKRAGIQRGSRAVRHRRPGAGTPPAASGGHPGILPRSRLGLYRSPLANLPLGTGGENPRSAVPAAYPSHAQSRVPGRLGSP